MTNGRNKQQQQQMQIPFGNDKQKGKTDSLNKKGETDSLNKKGKTDSLRVWQTKKVKQIRS
jgi:hypothetical protein